MTECWWIAVSNPSCERRATRGLQERGFVVWWPVRHVEIKTRHMQKPHIREYPMLPSYLFVRCDHRTHHEMHGVDGLRGILSNDGRAARIETWQIDRLKEKVAETRMETVDDAYRIGETVVVIKGALEGHLGTVSRGNRKGSVEILMRLFGSSDRPVEMSFRDLERV